MKVEKAVGWITGSNGTGIVYEISNGSAFLLATIWTDGKFHILTQQSFNDHLQSGKAGKNDSFRGGYSNSLSDQQIEVENPVGWSRLYNAAGPAPVPETGSTVSDILEIPVKFEGVLKINLDGLSKFLEQFN